MHSIRALPHPYKGMRPNFTGEWELIRGESDFGFLPPPRLRLDSVVHEDPHLRIRTRQKDASGGITVDRELTIGGEAREITIRGRTRLIRACWEEEALVVETIAKVSGKPRRIEDRWAIDTAAEWLTIDRLHEQPGGAVRQRLRFQRRSNPAIP